MNADVRSDNALVKVARMNTALRHEEPDRVPVGEFFWGSFLKRWREELGLPEDANPYQYYDLDWIVTVPNMDPHIKPFETIEETDREIIVKTGFGLTVRKRFELPMPEFISYEIDTIEKLESLEFDAADDPRRYFSAFEHR